MLKLPETVKIYVALQATDMRKQANGLSTQVMGTLNHEPTSGHLFVFFNRRRDIIRILFWDRDGYCVVSKRLERGKFRRLEVDGDSASISVTTIELHELFSGVVLPPKRTKPILH